MNCPICQKEVKNLQAHTRLAHPAEYKKEQGSMDIPKRIVEVGVPPVPKKKGKLEGIGEALNDKTTRFMLLVKVVMVALLGGTFFGGAFSLAGSNILELPFLWFAIVEGLILLAMKKDIGFNVKFHALKLLKRNPRVIYHIDGSKVITRLAVSYNPPTSSFKTGGKPSVDVEVTPDALLTDDSFGLPAGIHIGTERQLKNLFEEAGDYFTAKQVDLMVKDAEQLGELKSTEKLDKLVQIGYLVVGASAITVIVCLLTWSTVGEIQASFNAMIPILQQIPTLLQNTLGA